MNTISNGVSGNAPVSVHIHGGGTGKHTIHIDVDGVARGTETCEGWGVVPGNVVRVGSTSITLEVQVRDLTSQRIIVNIEEMVFVCVDENGKPTRHSLRK